MVLTDMACPRTVRLLERPNAVAKIAVPTHNRIAPK
jgi:hypothetical protein